MVLYYSLYWTRDIGLLLNTRPSNNGSPSANTCLCRKLTPSQIDNFTVRSLSHSKLVQWIAVCYHVFSFIADVINLIEGRICMSWQGISRWLAWTSSNAENIRLKRLPVRRSSQEFTDYYALRCIQNLSTIFPSIRVVQRLVYWYPPQRIRGMFQFWYRLRGR